MIGINKCLHSLLMLKTILMKATWSNHLIPLIVKTFSSFSLYLFKWSKYTCESFSSLKRRWVMNRVQVISHRTLLAYVQIIVLSKGGSVEAHFMPGWRERLTNIRQMTSHCKMRWMVWNEAGIERVVIRISNVSWACHLISGLQNNTQLSGRRSRPDWNNNWERVGG